MTQQEKRFGPSLEPEPGPGWTRFILCQRSWGDGEGSYGTAPLKPLQGFLWWKHVCSSGTTSGENPGLRSAFGLIHGGGWDQTSDPYSQRPKDWGSSSRVHDFSQRKKFYPNFLLFSGAGTDVCIVDRVTGRTYIHAHTPPSPITSCSSFTSYSP